MIASSALSPRPGLAHLEEELVYRAGLPDFLKQPTDRQRRNDHLRHVVRGSQARGIGLPESDQRRIDAVWSDEQARSERIELSQSSAVLVNDTIDAPQFAAAAPNLL